MTNPGLRERQRQQTAAAIHAAAIALVEERGLGAVTVAEIAATAGVSPRTFFNHYRTKEEALIPRVASFRQDEIDAFVRGDEPDLLAALAHLLAVQQQDMGGHEHTPSKRRIMRVLHANPELIPSFHAAFSGFETQIAELVRQRTGRRAVDLTCRSAAALASAMARIALESWEESRQGRSARPVTAEHFDTVFYGLRGLLAAPTTHPTTEEDHA